MLCFQTYHCNCFFLLEFFIGPVKKKLINKFIPQPTHAKDINLPKQIILKVYKEPLEDFDFFDTPTDLNN